MASSFIAPRTRWRRSPAMSASPVAVPAPATAQLAVPEFVGCLPAAIPQARGLPAPLLADLLARGEAGGYPADIKLIYSSGGDLFNQCPNVNKMVASLDEAEFIVAQDHFLTPTARYADIVLPATTFWERNDVHTPWSGAGHYAIFMRQAIEPICMNAATTSIFSATWRTARWYRRLQRQERAWTGCAISPVTPSTISSASCSRAWRDFRHRRTRWPARQIRDPENHPFSTPSGKIEIYSMTCWLPIPIAHGLGVIPPIPHLDRP